MSKLKSFNIRLSIVLIVMILAPYMLFGVGKIKYYASRAWSNKDKQFVYSDPITGTKPSTYYKVTYDKQNRILQVDCVTVKGLKAGKKVDTTIKEKYNKAGKLIEVVNKVGDKVINKTRISYNETSGRKERQEVYDHKDLLYYYTFEYSGGGTLKVQKGYSQADVPYGHWFYFDDQGLVVKIEDYDNEGKIILSKKIGYFANKKEEWTKIFDDNGKPIGDWTVNNQNGQLIKKMHYIDGVQDSKVEYEYDNKNEISKQKIYNEKNQVEEIITYTDGKVSLEEYYQENKKTGSCKYYYKNNRLEKREIFDGDDKLKDTLELDENGKPIYKKYKN